MPNFALVVDGEFREARSFEERPPNIPHKQVEWLPYIGEEGEPEGVFIERDRVRHVVRPAALPRRQASRLTIIRRLEEVGKLDAAQAALDAAPIRVRARWYAMQFGPYVDDPDTLALLRAIGADPAVILAPE